MKECFHGKLFLVFLKTQPGSEAYLSPLYLTLINIIEGSTVF